MKLEEVKGNRETMAKLRWDLTPQTGTVSSYEFSSQDDLERLRQRLKSLEGYYFYVDVWNCRARLALMHNTGDGGGRSEVIEDFHSPLLEKAVYEAGGSINQSGWYPLSNALRSVLQRKLERRKEGTW